MARKIQHGELLRCAAAGIEFVVIFVACVGGGIFLDRRLSTAPGLMLIGAVLGLLVGIFVLYRQIQAIITPSGDDSDLESQNKSVETPVRKNDDAGGC